MFSLYLVNTLYLLHMYSTTVCILPYIQHHHLGECSCHVAMLSVCVAVCVAVWLQVDTGVLIVRHEGLLRLWAGWRPAVARAMCYGGALLFGGGRAGLIV